MQLFSADREYQWQFATNRHHQLRRRQSRQPARYQHGFNLGSGGTHIDKALHSVNALITSVGDGSSSNNTLPFVFLVTDGAQDPQMKGTPNGGWSGSNHAVTLTDSGNSYPASAPP